MAAQTVLTKGTQVTKQTAQAVARVIATQTHETLKTAQDQVGLPRSENLPVSERPQETESFQESVEQFVPQLDRVQIANQERAMLSQLEAKLAQIRARKTQELASYKDAQQSKMDSQTNASAQQEVVEPQGKVRKAMGKAKKAITNLISNRKQGESKQGAGKG